MPILTDEQIAEIRRRVAEGGTPPRECRYDLSPLRTQAEVFGYCIEVARREGWNEVEVIDALLRVAAPYREDVRDAEHVLRSLGYTAVSDHLKNISRRLSLRPPKQWLFLPPQQADVADQSWLRRPAPARH
ncbi:hypothetical protein QA640_24300 [Bradyrhizobium sp. CB82]|uniref:hypothetical protein n=1 Tax=Bradyrhizobium sp. CB82 TaxID=3039159 RepID=UPI0024B0F83B|nr:hypothetical protein [Bradyrhizobium sp. CB82]WFU37592.1 hypothetical protein QA640_24300 [Bradyrhizobium sp. CB82]